MTFGALPRDALERQLIFFKLKLLWSVALLDLSFDRFWHNKLV